MTLLDKETHISHCSLKSPPATKKYQFRGEENQCRFIGIQDILQNISFFCYTDFEQGE